jgi:hypothetical protein
MTHFQGEVGLDTEVTDILNVVVPGNTLRFGCISFSTPVYSMLLRLKKASQVPQVLSDVECQSLLLHCLRLCKSLVSSITEFASLFNFFLPQENQSTRRRRERVTDRRPPMKS